MPSPQCYVGLSQSCMGYRAAGQAQPSPLRPQQMAGPPLVPRRFPRACVRYRSERGGETGFASAAWNSTKQQTLFSKRLARLNKRRAYLVHNFPLTTGEREGDWSRQGSGPIWHGAGIPLPLFTSTEETRPDHKHRQGRLITSRPAHVSA